MSSRVTSDLDPFSPEFRADPFAFYAELRALGPIVWLERYGIWVVSHYEQVRAVLTDYDVFSNAGGGGLTNYFEVPPWRQPSIILEADPPAPQQDQGRTDAGRVRDGRSRHASTAFKHVADSAWSTGRWSAGTLRRDSRFGAAVSVDGVSRRGRIGEGGAGKPADLWRRWSSAPSGRVTPWHEELMRQAPEPSARMDSGALRSAKPSTPVGLGASIYAAADTGEITT